MRNPVSIWSKNLGGGGERHTYIQTFSYLGGGFGTIFVCWFAPVLSLVLALNYLFIFNVWYSFCFQDFAGYKQRANLANIFTIFA